ncbi:MAG: M23/M56 family metallopeptidase [Pseudomonadota bacterium]
MTLLSLVVCSILWTGLLAGGTECLTRKNMTAYGAQALWRISAALMIAPWIIFGATRLWPDTIASVPAILPWPDVPDIIEIAIVESGIIAAAPAETTNHSQWIHSAIAAVLVLGWIMRGTAAVAGHVWLKSLQRQRFPLNDPAIVDAVNRAAKLAGLRQAPSITGIDTNHSPFVSGLTKPVLHLPSASLEGDRSNHILLHECIHIARGDLVTRPLERLVSDLIWFSPFAWLTRQRLDQWREAVCDAEAARLSGDRAGYARALLDTARNCRPTPPLPVATLFSNPKRTLMIRITTLMIEPTKTSSRRRLVGGVLTAILIAPLTIAPGLAQNTGASVPSSAFLAAIIDDPNARITSSFGERIHPITKEPVFHSGTDIGAPFGTDISLPAAGEVITTGEKRGYGLIVEVELEGSRDRLRFAQLQSYNVKVGDRLSAGDVIGEVGASGRATGPHLHIEYLDRSANNRPSDPEAIEGLQLIAGE